MHISPHAYTNNYLKKDIPNNFSFSDKIIVNSNEFKKQFKSIFKINSRCIYNPVENLRYRKNKQIKKLILIFLIRIV